jgi:hypothetical protein
LRVRDWLEKNEKKAAWPIRFIELPEQRVEDIVLPHKAILLAMWQNVRRQVSAYGTKHRLELRIPVVMEIPCFAWNAKSNLGLLFQKYGSRAFHFITDV